MQGFAQQGSQFTEEPVYGEAGVAPDKLAVDITVLLNGAHSGDQMLLDQAIHTTLWAQETGFFIFAHVKPEGCRAAGFMELNVAMFG